MKARLSLICIAALAACGTAKEAPPAQSLPTDRSVQAVRPLIPAGNLTGEYRVAGIDGAAIDAPFGLALSISDTRIDFDGPCGGYAWDYLLEGTRLENVRTVSPYPACLARARIHHRVFDLARALDAVTVAERTPANGIELSGADRSVTLYSQ